MFILSLCPVTNYDPILGWTDIVGFVGVAAFLAIPVVIFIFLWRNFATNAPDPRSEVVTLGLDEPPIYFEEAGPSTWMVGLYLLMGLVTFSLGVLASEVVHALG
jgi:hypothetical protein